MSDARHGARPSPDAAGPFLALARRTGRRLALGRWLAALHVSAVPLFGFAVAGLAAAHLTGMTSLPLVARAVLPAGLLLVAAWLSTSALWAWTRRPHHAAVLALFDERTADHETFVSAASFAQDPQRGPGRELHLRRARALLAEASAKVSQAVPIRTTPATVLAPLLFLGLTLFGLPAVAMTAGEEDATEQAAAVGERLDEEARTLDLIEKGLTPEEKKKLDALKERMQSSARKMADPEKEKSARDVLEELERRAREAEVLAASLGAGAETLGSAMLAELERHADTAELAGALRAQKLKPASTEAAKLARRLRAEDLSLEAQKRIESAFSNALEVATPADLKTLLGQHMTTAQGELERKAPERAADEFDRLARRYAEMDRRLRSREALERLAENLRTSGQRALGRNQRNVQRLASLPASGLSQVGTQPPRLSSAATAGLTGRFAPPSGNTPSKTSPGSSAPVPGSQSPAGKPCPGCPNCGKPLPKGKAPVPGTRAGSQSKAGSTASASGGT